MPDPYDFDAARRALDEVPAPDLWAEAEHRAADRRRWCRARRRPSAAPAAVVGGGGVAAIVAVGAAALAWPDDDRQQARHSPGGRSRHDDHADHDHDRLVGR